RTGNATNCTAGESIEFTASASGYPIGCAAHTFTWSFGDNTSATGQDVNHVYGAAGTKSVTLTVKNAQQTFTQTVSVPVGGIITPPPPPPPPPPQPGFCATMTTDNWALTFAGNSGCSWLNNSTVGCAAAESLSFSAQPLGYLISCATHTFSWNFGDGS